MLSSAGSRQVLLRASIASSGSKKSAVRASRRNWLVCAVRPRSLETVSRGCWIRLLGIWPDATAAECSRLRWSSIACRSSEDRPR